jgi:hypothetical protein
MGISTLVTANSGTGANPGPGRVAVLRGNGSGVFQVVPGSQVSVLPSPRLVALADVNGDRRADVVLSHEPEQLSLLLNAGSSRFALFSAAPFNLGAHAFGVVVADVNEDQKLDLIAATVNSVTVLLADRNGYVPAPGSPFGAGPGAYNLAVGDVNEDGKLDIAASSFESDAVTLLLGR